MEINADLFDYIIDDIAPQRRFVYQDGFYNGIILRGEAVCPKKTKSSKEVALLDCFQIIMNSKNKLLVKYAKKYVEEHTGEAGW